MSRRVQYIHKVEQNILGLFKYDICSSLFWCKILFEGNIELVVETKKNILKIGCNHIYGLQLEKIHIQLFLSH